MVPTRGQRRSLCLAASFGCAVGLLFQATASAISPAPSPSPGKNPRRNPAQAENTPEVPPTNSKPEIAVVYDDVYRPPAKDLLLALDSERKAEANALFIHGIILEETSDADKATDEYQKSLALDPSNVELSVKIAWDDLRRGDTPGAINLLKDTIKAAPKQARPCLALAYIYFNNLNKVDLALKYSQQALELDPANISCYEYLRDMYKATGQAAKIPALLDRAAKADTKEPMFWLRLGALYAEVYLADDPSGNTEDLKKTTPIFQKALSYGNNEVEIIGKIADFFVATKQLAEAIPLYKRVIDIDPAQNTARENLARCYLGLNQPDKAAEALEDLIKINPVQPHAYETLAKIYEDAGEMEKAAQDYEQSLLISPNEPGTYESLAKRLLVLKKPERAVTVLNEAQETVPGCCRVRLPAGGFAGRSQAAPASVGDVRTSGSRSAPYEQR